MILQALLDEGTEGAAVGVLCDPETVAQAHEAGVEEENGEGADPDSTEIRPVRRKSDSQRLP